MKKYLIILLSVLGACSELKKVNETTRQTTQKDDAYIPYSQFKKDTLGYIRTDFIKNKGKYVHHELNVLLNDVELPVLDYVPSLDFNTHYATSLALSFDNSRLAMAKESSGNPSILIHVVWETPIPDSTQYRIMRKYHAWNSETQQFYGKRIIKDVFLDNRYK